MDAVVSVKNKNFSGNPEKLAKVLGARRGNQKSFTQTIPWNFACLVKNYPEIIVRQHHSDQKRMGGTSAVLLQSSLDNE